MTRRDFLLYSSALTATTLNANLLYNDDIFLSALEYKSLISMNKKLTKVKHHIGYANFNLVSYSEVLKVVKHNSKIGEFNFDELSIIDRLFNENPSKYGFFGERTCYDINNKISKKDVIKIPRTGHYIFKGTPTQDYKRIIGDIGDTLYLTSGVRNVMKQLNLYSNKLIKLNGNITQASRDIAPPSYSFHSIGDFDVGKMGLGAKNFTSAFAKTQEFTKMKKLDYIEMRYTHNNSDGVRFEPWHVKII